MKTKCLAFIFILVFGIITPVLPHNSDQNITAAESELFNFVETIQGTWAEPFTNNDGSRFIITIEPHNISGDKIRIQINDYYLPGIIDYLWFRLDKDKLVYTEASYDDCFFDLTRIEYIHIWTAMKGADPVLVYEAREAEYQNFVFRKLTRITPDNYVTGTWACGLQEVLTSYLSEDNFRVFNAEGYEVTPEMAFGTAAVVEEMEFFEDNAYLWPMYEEICIRTDFDMVVIGGFYPGGSATIYAIEWDPEEIRLYQTYVAPGSEDGTFPILKGDLIYRILPGNMSNFLYE